MSTSACVHGHEPLLELDSERQTTSAMHAGCTFENFDGERVINAQFGGLSLENSKLRFNNMTESVLSALSGSGFVSIADTTIASNMNTSAPTLYAYEWRSGDDPVFYADEVLDVTRDSPWPDEERSETQSEPLADWPAGQGLTAEDPFLMSMQTVRPWTGATRDIRCLLPYIGSGTLKFAQLRPGHVHL